ncbi:hypothetical protein D3C75_1247370 [compost metagenome]
MKECVKLTDGTDLTRAAVDEVFSQFYVPRTDQVERLGDDSGFWVSHMGLPRIVFNRVHSAMLNPCCVYYSADLGHVIDSRYSA